MDVKTPKKVLERIQPDIDAKICIAKGCEKTAHARGLCSACLKAANRLIDRGTITEDEMIRRGGILPKKDAGRKATCALAKQFAAAS